MARKICSILLVMILVLAGVGHADYVSSSVITVNGVDVTPEELDTIMSAYMVRALLSIWENGFSYDMHDTLNLVDALDKVMFDVESLMIMREQAEEMGLELSPEDRMQAAESADRAWQEYLEKARDYLDSQGMEEVMAAEFLWAYGLNRDLLESEEMDSLLETLVENEVTAGTVSEDERIEVYVDWLIERRDESEIREDATAAAEVCLTLAGREISFGQ